MAPVDGIQCDIAFSLDFGLCTLPETRLPIWIRQSRTCATEPINGQSAPIHWMNLYQYLLLLCIRITT